MVIEDFDNMDIEEIEEKQTQSEKKPKVITDKKQEMFKFSDNNHIADLQQRVIRLEYELLFIRDKLFTESPVTKEQKLSPYGRIVKRRINHNG